MVSLCHFDYKSTIEKHKPDFAHEKGELGTNIAIAAYTFFLDISEAESLRYAVSQEFVASAGVLYDTLRNRKQQHIDPGLEVEG